MDAFGQLLKSLEWLFLTALFGFILAFKEEVLPPSHSTFPEVPPHIQIFCFGPQATTTFHHDIRKRKIFKIDEQACE